MAQLGFRPVGRIILGSEYSGFQLKYYEAGTTTLKTTFTDSALTGGNENTNPVVLDARGAAQVWFGGDAKVEFLDADDVVIYTDDNINLLQTLTSAGEFNLVLNPSFEDDTDADGIPDNWDRVVHSGGTVARSTTTGDQRHGVAGMKFTSAGSGGGYITTANFFPVSVDRDLGVSFAVNASVVDIRNLVQLLWFKDDKTAAATPSTDVWDESAANPTSWTLKQFHNITPPTAAVFAKLRMHGAHSSDPTSGENLYDNVIVVEEDETNQFVWPLGNAGRMLVVNAAEAALEYWVPRGHIDGLVLSNGTDTTNDIDIAIGECADSDNDHILKLTAAMGKQIDVNWAAGGTPGTPAGGFPSGLTLTNDTGYHFFLIKKDSDGTIDSGFDTSLTATNLLSDATGYTEYRRVGSILYGTATIEQFFDLELGRVVDREWVSNYVDLTSSSESAQNPTLTVATGLSVIAKVGISGSENTNASSFIVLSSGLRTSGRVASATVATGAGSGADSAAAGAKGGYSLVQTDTSGKIFSDMHMNAGAAIAYALFTQGYIDPRP